MVILRRTIDLLGADHFVAEAGIYLRIPTYPHARRLQQVPHVEARAVELQLNVATAVGLSSLLQHCHVGVAHHHRIPRFLFCVSAVPVKDCLEAPAEAGGPGFSKVKSNCVYRRCA